MISTATVPGTDVTISIEQHGARYVVTRDNNGDTALVVSIQLAWDTEEDARNTANYLWTQTVEHRNARVAGRPVPQPISRPTWQDNKRTATAKVLASRPEVDVPAGRYALASERGVRFYRVDRPTQGQWAGRTFVKVQAGDVDHNIRNYNDRQAILREIAADPKEAMLRYGREIGSCGHCGRTLTNDESRAAGIGPICRGKMGW